MPGALRRPREAHGPAAGVRRAPCQAAAGARGAARPPPQMAAHMHSACCMSHTTHAQLRLPSAPALCTHVACESSDSGRSCTPASDSGRLQATHPLVAGVRKPDAALQAVWHDVA